MYLHSDRHPIPPKNHSFLVEFWYWDHSILVPIWCQRWFKLYYSDVDVVCVFANIFHIDKKREERHPYTLFFFSFLNKVSIFHVVFGLFSYQPNISCEDKSLIIFGWFNVI